MPLSGIEIAALINAGVNLLSSSKEGGKASALTDEAVDLARQDFDQRQPLRQAFMQGIGAPVQSAPDLRGLLTDTTNPFSAAHSAPTPHVGSRLAGIDLSKLDLSRRPPPHPPAGRGGGPPGPSDSGTGIEELGGRDIFVPGTVDEDALISRIRSGVGGEGSRTIRDLERRVLR